MPKNKSSTHTDDIAKSIDKAIDHLISASAELQRIDINLGGVKGVSNYSLKIEAIDTISTSLFIRDPDEKGS